MQTATCPASQWPTSASVTVRLTVLWLDKCCMYVWLGTCYSWLPLVTFLCKQSPTLAYFFLFFLNKSSDKWQVDHNYLAKKCLLELKLPRPHVTTQSNCYYNTYIIHRVSNLVTKHEADCIHKIVDQHNNPKSQTTIS